MVNEMVFRVGDMLKCQYPREGWRNILASREGTIVRLGRQYVTIQNAGLANTRKYTTMYFSKMVSPSTERASF
jgi:hypothetical protein